MYQLRVRTLVTMGVLASVLAWTAGGCASSRLNERVEAIESRLALDYRSRMIDGGYSSTAASLGGVTASMVGPDRLDQQRAKQAALRDAAVTYAELLEERIRELKIQIFDLRTELARCQEQHSPAPTSPSTRQSPSTMPQSPYPKP